MARKVIEIREDMDALHDMLMEIDDIEVLESDEVQHAFNHMAEEFDAEMNSKADSIAAIVTVLESQADTRKSEADRMNSLAKTDANKAKWLKNWLRDIMNHLGADKLKTDRYNLTVAKNGGRIPVTIHGDVPTDYLTYTQVTEVNKDLIRHKLDSGESLSFANLEERGTHLRIK